MPAPTTEAIDEGEREKQGTKERRFMAAHENGFLMAALGLLPLDLLPADARASAAAAAAAFASAACCWPPSRTPCCCCCAAPPCAADPCCCCAGGAPAAAACSPPKKPAEVEPQAVAAGWEGHPRALEPAAVVVAAASRGGARGQQRLACAAAACAQRRVRSQVAGDTVGLASGATTYIETEAVCTTGRRHRYPAGARPRAAPRRPCCCCCCCKGTCVPGGCRLPEAADFQRQLLWRPRHAPVWATKDEPGAMQEAQAAERSMAAHAAPLGWAQRSHPWAYAWPTCSKANGGRREGWNALLRGEATAGHPRAYVAWGPPACSTALTSAGEAEACPSARIPPACAPMPPQRIHPPACTAHQQAC